MRPRNKFVAYLFCFPLGILGLHKFYLHQPLLGVVYFFTGGLLVVGWLYDLVTLPDQVDRYNEKHDLLTDVESMLEEEIEELEDELYALRREIKHLRGNSEVAALKRRVRELEDQLAREADTNPG